MKNHALPTKLALVKSGSDYESSRSLENMIFASSHPMFTEISFNQGKPNNISAFLSDTSEFDSEVNLEKVSSTSDQVHERSRQISEEVASLKGQIIAMSIPDEVPSVSTGEGIPMETPEELKSELDFQLQAKRRSEQKSKIPERSSSMEVTPTVDIDDVVVKDGDKHENVDQDGRMLEEEKHIVQNASSNKFSLDVNGNQVMSESDSPLIRNGVRRVRSVRSLMESSRSNGSAGGYLGKISSLEVNSAEKRRTSSDSKTQGLEQRINILERELREAAALEVALYSVVAEHGSSTNKVHAPARRLSRLYLQAGKGMKRASAAQSSVSGLIVVAKACGNDVPRYACGAFCSAFLKYMALQTRFLPVLTR